MKRKIYKMNSAGSIENLKMQTEDIPSTSSGEVQIQVEAIGLNFADVFAIHGLYSATPKGSFIPGLEYSGIVTELGENTSKFKIGDRVMGVTKFGAYATHINADEKYLNLIPEKWTIQEGASYLVQAITAYYALFTLGALKKGMTVLIHSGAGGVGILANRMAKTFGAYTVGTVGNKSKIPLLMDEGYDMAIVRDANFRKSLEKLATDRPIDLILESIGGRIQKIGYKFLAPQGRMVVFGAASYATNSSRPNYLKLLFNYLTRPKIDPQQMMSENKSLLAFNLIWLYENIELMNEIIKDMNQIDIGAPLIGVQFDFVELKSAVKSLQSGMTVGKVIVNVNH